MKYDNNNVTSSLIALPDISYPRLAAEYSPVVFRLTPRPSGAGRSFSGIAAGCIGQSAGSRLIIVIVIVNVVSGKATVSHRSFAELADKISFTWACIHLPV